MVTLPNTAGAALHLPRESQNDKPKLLHLQVLRVMAASVVIVDHAILELNLSGAPTSQYTFAAYLLGHMGVVAFFVVSGFIMMRQTADQFGVPSAPKLFAWHRLIRIVPLYWLATVLRLASEVAWHNPTPHAGKQLLLSLAFIPDYLSGKVNLMPILDIGWTLNYEMSFYLIFTLCLFLPRRIGVWLLVLVPLILPHFHKVSLLPADHPLSAVFSFYTDPIIRFFALGVLFGYLELKFLHLRRISLSLSPALLLIVAAVVLLTYPATLGVPGNWNQAARLAAAIAVACTIFTLNKPGPFNRLLVLLGDASYCTYLFHLWINGFLVPHVLQIFHHFHREVTSPVLVVMVCVLCGNAAGVLIHLLLERPLTRALRAFKIGVSEAPVQMTA